MKYAKLLRTACLAAALVCGAAVGNAKNGVVPKMYMFGFAASFSDSIVHFTDVQELKDVWIDTKTNFLLGRDSYSYQLRDYLAEHGMKDATCITSFALKQKDAEKKYLKLRKKYLRGNKFDIKMLAETDFKFEAIALPKEGEE